MTKEQKDQYIDANILMLSKMINALSRIKNGESEKTVLEELDINQGIFRKYLYRETLGYKGPECCENNDYNFSSTYLPTLSGAERLWLAIMGESNYLQMPPKIEKPIEKALKKLKNREIRILRMRFWEGLSLEQVGKIYDISKDRVREIEAKALRKLRHPNISTYLRYGEDFHVKIETERIERQNKINEAILKKYMAAKEKGYTIATRIVEETNEDMAALVRGTSIMLSDLNLTPRTHNALTRAGFKSLGEITEKTEEEIKRTRNMGEKSFAEIKNILKKYDLTFRD